MTRDEASRLAEQSGFTHWGFFPVSGLRFKEEVRAMCASDRCNSYGRSWSCPPACGTLEESREKAERFTWGILLQTTGTLEDDFDVEVMLESGELQKKRVDGFVNAIGPNERFFAMSAGACTRCETCTYPDAPCRFPDRMLSSMEAYGLVVSEVCELAGVPYYYGPLTITYSSCVLF